MQALTMLLAGYETTAGALTFTIYLLSRSCNADKQVPHKGQKLLITWPASGSADVQ